MLNIFRVRCAIISSQGVFKVHHATGCTTPHSVLEEDSPTPKPKWEGHWRKIWNILCQEVQSQAQNPSKSCDNKRHLEPQVWWSYKDAFVHTEMHSEKLQSFFYSQASYHLLKFTKSDGKDFIQEKSFSNCEKDDVSWPMNSSEKFIINIMSSIRFTLFICLFLF